jgi:hypothetical protein
LLFTFLVFMNTHQNKILSTIIITVITFLGFESLSVIIGLNEVGLFQTTAAYLFLFHIAWIAFMFDLHLKNQGSVALGSAKFRFLIRQAIVQRFEHFFQWKYFKHFINYFVLPSILFWATAGLLFLNPFRAELKQIIIVASTITYCLNFLHMNEHLTAKMESRSGWLKLLSLAKLFAAYEAYAAIIGLSWYLGLEQNVIFYFVLAVTFFLIYQALFAYGYHKPGLVFTAIFLSAIVAWIGTWVYHNWNYQYFTGALMLLALYNTIWGFIHHILEKTFTSKVALEYLILGLLVVSIILATHNFGTRIV